MREFSCLGSTEHHGLSEYHLIMGVDHLIHGDKVHVILWADFWKWAIIRLRLIS